MIQQLKNTISKFTLNKVINASNRKVAAINFHQLRNVGIVFSVEDERDFRVVKTYVRLLKEEGIKHVKAIGFYNNKVLAHYLQPSLDFDFYCTSELNWYGKPVGADCENFMNQDFEVLIDLCEFQHYSTRFLIASSNASFKIGRRNKLAEKLYDLILEIEYNKNINYFIEQINHYLNLINKPKNVE